MDLVQFGCIERITFPDDWSSEPEQATALLRLASVHPAEHADVEISLFQKMQGVQTSEIQDFRDILNKPEHKIVESAEQLLLLSPILGNAGNNQWSNKTRGVGGPPFRFTSGETKRINSRTVLQIQGTFIQPESKESVNQHCGIFIDSGAERNLVQEIYLQVPCRHGYFQFEQYMKIFTQVLATVIWK